MLTRTHIKLTCDVKNPDVKHYSSYHITSTNYQ